MLSGPATLASRAEKTSGQEVATAGSVGCTTMPAAAAGSGVDCTHGATSP